MKKYGAACVLLVGLCGAFAAGAQDAASSLHWQKGPGSGAIDGRAAIAIPDGYVFLDRDETTKYVEMSHNLSNGDEYFFAPGNDAWEAYFSFNEEGYVKDTETLDADALLKSIRDNQVESNEERKRRGWPAFTVTGWRIAPRYNPTTKVLAWATEIKEEGNNHTSVNYNTRVLGRKGTMSVVLVAAPQDFDAALVGFQARLNGFHFNDGERYADYRPGDHVAEYGLAALVAGGAAAVAAKKGFFTVIAGFLAAAWKLVIAGVAGIGAWLRSVFRKKAA